MVHNLWLLFIIINYYSLSTRPRSRPRRRRGECRSTANKYFSHTTRLHYTRGFYCLKNNNSPVENTILNFHTDSARAAPAGRPRAVSARETVHKRNGNEGKNCEMIRQTQFDVGIRLSCRSNVPRERTYGANNVLKPFYGKWSIRYCS